MLRHLLGRVGKVIIHCLKRTTNKSVVCIIMGYELLDRSKREEWASVKDTASSL